MSALERFKVAQESSAGFARALDEIKSGRKRGHWIWYVFPQLDGLGRSPMAHRYAIAGEDEAIEYLKDPELRSRLLTIATAVAEQVHVKGLSLTELMGSTVDVLKLVSSLTLFGRVAERLYAAEDLDEYRWLRVAADQILARAAAEGYGACEHTLKRLSAEARPTS
jgi:uncharacterized protein (DUF1810 family)